MELIQKYKLALLQLQEYSDNELIIQESAVLNIPDELKELEDESKNLKGWTLYLEDFSTDSPEFEHLFKNGELKEITIFYK